MPRAILFSLEDRLSDDLAVTKGTMPITVILADEGERRAAAKWLLGRRHASLLELVTREEADAARKAWLATMKRKPRPPRVVL